MKGWAFSNLLDGPMPRSADVIKSSPGKLADQIYEDLKENYPGKVLGWVRDTEWQGPGQVDLKKIDLARRPGGRDMGKVRSMAREIKNGKRMDPVVLVDRGERTLAIADGYHRALAHQHAGKSSILAYVGTVDDATGPWDRAMHDAKLNKMLQAGLAKVGPKGYIHGWIFVGAPGAGGRVFHPQHGHGSVHEHRGDSVSVHFDSGHKADFAAGHQIGTPRLEETEKRPSITDVFHGHDPAQGESVDVTEDFRSRVEGEFAGLQVKIKSARVRKRSHNSEKNLLITAEVHENGRIVGDFQRRFSDEPGIGVVATHDYMELDPSVQGQGFASAMNKHMEKLYRESDVKQIQLTANIDVGGYAWARKGFDWRSQDDVESVMERVRDAAYASHDSDVIDEYKNLERRISMARFGSPEYPTPKEMSELGIDKTKDGTWAGRSGMLGSSWNGVKYL